MELAFFMRSNMAFILCSRMVVGALSSFSYVFWSARRLFIFSSYWTLSTTTVALPLSAGSTRMQSSCWRLLVSLHSCGSRFTEGGLALLRAPNDFGSGHSACSSGTCIRPLSTAATISAVGILVCAGAKFSPFLRTTCSTSDRGLEDRFTNHLGWVSVVLCFCMCH